MKVDNINIAQITFKNKEKFILVIIKKDSLIKDYQLRQSLDNFFKKRHHCSLDIKLSFSNSTFVLK